MKNFAAARRFGYRTNANSFINPNAVEIVGRERRGHVSQLAWCGEGCFDTPPRQLNRWADEQRPR